MLKVLIVDDEFIVRAGLISCMNWEQMGLSLIGEASNGQEALEMILRETPDIILLDLIMPVMNGMELIQKLDELNIHTNIVILSCHEDYSYVRQAFKHGVRDYILKLSSTPDEITNVIKDVVKKILDSRENVSPLPEITIFKTSEFLDEKGMLPGRNHYIIASFHFLDHFMTDSSLLQHLLANNMVNNSSLSGSLHTYLLEGTLPFIVYSFPPDKLSDEDALHRFTELIEELHSYLKEYLKSSLRIGISGVSETSKPFSKTFRESQKALDELFYNDVQPVGVYSHLIGMYTPDKSPDRISFQHNIEELTKRQSYTKLKDLVLHYFENHRKSASTDPRLIKLDSIDLINSLNNSLRIQNYTLSDVDEEYLYYYQNIANMHSFRKLASYVLTITESVCSFLESNGPRNIRRDILNAIDYIEEHYGMDISLTDVANYINISKNHLSYLFKKEIGQTFSDYLIQVRIQKAKELLNFSSGSSIGEIAERVGFNDTGYFSKVFKKATGFSPYNYKRGL